MGVGAPPRARLSAQGNGARGRRSAAAYLLRGSSAASTWRLRSATPAPVRRAVRSRPDGCDLGICEADPGDALVAGTSLLAQDAGGDHPALVLGDVGEDRHAGRLSERPEACSRAAVLVDDDSPALVQTGACGLEPEAGGPRASPASKEDHARLDARALGDLDGIP